MPLPILNAMHPVSVFGALDSCQLPGYCAEETTNVGRQTASDWLTLFRAAGLTLRGLHLLP